MTTTPDAADQEQIDYELTVNGQPRSVRGAWYHEPLSFVLRERLGLTGTKYACDEGQCGACTVLLDGAPVNSCITLAADVQDREITTIEGYSPADGSLTPLQESLLRHGDIQCGYCLPGIVLAASVFIEEHPDATEDEVREGMVGNLCRCTGYQGIIDGIREASRS